MTGYPDKSTDVTILTEPRYVDMDAQNPYYQNIRQEDGLVREALEKKGLRVDRRSWDDPDYEWTSTAFLLFRSTWDYFDRFHEFSLWLERVKNLTRMINPYEIISWNLDKHYLLDLAGAGIHIPPSLFLEKGEAGSLAEKLVGTDWKEVILKPVVSGAARHTYRFLPAESGKHEALYQKLIREEAMMLQEFQEQVPLRGEVAFMLFDGKYTHAILKKARDGDFRVQDDFGGTVHTYKPSAEEISFAENVVKRCGHHPLYARVDAIWDNQGRLAVSELELIEPELWFRFHEQAAGSLASAIVKHYFTT